MTQRQKGMTPEQFVEKWAKTPLNEKQTAQAHFLDVCQLVEVEMPGGDGKTDSGEVFVFEQSIKTGFADVFYENHFAIEYKSPDKYKDLSAAYQQLQRYREALNNPPLLVVTDINHWEIHSNFPNTAKTVYRFHHEEIADHLHTLRAMFHAPERLHPRRQAEQVTQDAAKAFEKIADNMRQWDADPQRIAYFLTKLVFCLFAEDIGLLPAAFDSPDGIFTHIVEHSRKRPGIFQQYVRNLFVAMNDGGDFLMQDIRYFNGTLFDVVTVEELSAEAIDALAEAARLDWANIEPSIFGTLFERSLDPAKRSQLGAHYTSRDDILLIVEPVLMQPLRYAWDTAQLEAEPIRERYNKATTGRDRANAARQLLDLRADILDRVRSITVLDPACGSGNFLYVSLQMLMDLEKEIITHPLWNGLQLPTPAVHPRQMYGIEINPIAHALASIVVWIGFIQWRYKNGYHNLFSEPILEKLEENIVCKDAILPPAPTKLPPSVPPKHQGDEASNATTRVDNRRGDSVSRPQDADPNETRRGDSVSRPQDADPNETRRGDSVSRPHDAAVDWPQVDVIVGNPPFLGDKRMRGELGDEYVNRLRARFAGRVPGGADLVTFWFEVAREHIEQGKVKRAGLLATNSIRIGTNRAVLSRIKSSGDIFMAWSDRQWPLDGANVRVAMIGFDDGSENVRALNGIPVSSITSDLTASVDVVDASPLAENENLSFLGVLKTGPFDLEAHEALSMIGEDSANSEVVKRRRNGRDLVSDPSYTWIIDFLNMNERQAMQYVLPYEYVKKTVKPIRDKNKVRNLREKWWQHARPRYAMRNATRSLSRFIVTPEVTKHRIFVWLQKDIVPDHTLHVLARDDDYFFGVLQSEIHVLWAIRMGSTLGPAPRYNSSRTFKTFPFPWSPGHEDLSHPAHARISAAAKQLHQERHAWLHPDPGKLPPDSSGRPKGMKDRTLTNLYNALQVYRGESSIRIKPAAGDFAPRLDALHRELDEAVCDAYGWGYETLEDEEEILRRLLALNLERAGD